MRNLYIAISMLLLLVSNFFLTCWGWQYWGPGSSIWWGFPLTVCLLCLSFVTAVIGFIYLAKWKGLSL